MTLKGPEFKKALLLGLVATAIPLFYFPSTFGWEGATQGTGRVYLLELAYYVTVFYLFWSREKFSQVLAAAATGFGFRLLLGLVFATLLGGVYNVPLPEAVAVGMHRYLPGVALHVALVPFLLRPVFRFRELRRPPRRTESPAPAVRPERTATAAPEPAPWTGSADHVPDFHAAVSHVAAYPSVELALLVDREGLSVARSARGHADSELWAPLVNLLDAAVRRELARTPDQDVQRFTLDLKDRRLVVECVPPFFLAVLFDRGTDELVNVRIAQASEMVKRYYEHRYRKVAPSTATEVAYV